MEENVENLFVGDFVAVSSNSTIMKISLGLA